MNELIDGLLTYSRMERRQLEAETLDLSALVHQVLEEFSENMRGMALKSVRTYRRL